MKHIFLYISIFCSISFLQGQKCWIKHEIYDSLLHNQLEQFTRDYTGTKRALARTEIEVPVVVHVVWNEEEENISDAQVESQIDALNRDFNLFNGDIGNVPDIFQPLVGNANFSFYLAPVDEEGNPTNGITRTQTRFEDIGITFRHNDPLIYYTDRGGKDAWNTERYLNIWVAAMPQNGGPIGFATRPGQAMPAEDGIVIDYRHFGTLGTVSPPNNLGRTTTHEVGHYFNLIHLHGDDPNDCSIDDLVEDTPFQNDNYFGCPEFPQATCNSPDLTVNFLNTVDDNCMFMFTKGQVERMHAALMEARSGLLNPLVTTTSLEVVNTTYVKVSPNPAAQYLLVELLQFSEPLSFHIIDTRGSVVQRGILANRHNDLLIERHLQAGIYWLLIFTKKGTIPTKLLLI